MEPVDSRGFGELLLTDIGEPEARKGKTLMVVGYEQSLVGPS